MKYSSQQQNHIVSPPQMLHCLEVHNKKVPLEICFDGIRHYPLHNPAKPCCSYCGKKSKYVCAKCDIGLHIDCFESYHENVNQ